jgi:hypothetical protein
VLERGALPECVGSPDALVAGGCDDFTVRLERWGVPPDIVRQLVAAAEAHARDTLHESEPSAAPLDLVKLGLIAAMGV